MAPVEERDGKPERGTSTRRRGDAEENAEKIRGKKSLEEAEKRAGEG
jgi:hypothetical protein